MFLWIILCMIHDEPWPNVWPHPRPTHVNMNGTHVYKRLHSRLGLSCSATKTWKWLESIPAPGFNPGHFSGSGGNDRCFFLSCSMMYMNRFLCSHSLFFFHTLTLRSVTARQSHKNSWMNHISPIFQGMMQGCGFLAAEWKQSSRNLQLAPVCS